MGYLDMIAMDVGTEEHRALLFSFMGVVCSVPVSCSSTMLYAHYSNFMLFWPLTISVI